MAAGLAFGLGLFVVNGVMFMRSPAFTHVHPDAGDTLVALVGTVGATLLATLAALAFDARMTGGEPAPRVATTVVPVTPRA